MAGTPDYVYLDEDGLLYLKSLLDSHFQAQETGKGLSENDFTDTLKSKLDGIAANATANAGTVTAVKANSEQAISPDANGVVDLGTVLRSHQDISGLAPKASPTFTGTPAAPTATTGTNTTQIATTAFVKAAIDAALAGITGVTFSFVQQLPASGQTGVFYFVPQSGGGSTGDVYDEYIWDSTNSAFEKIGTTAVDLSGYVQASQMGAISNSTIDSIFNDW